MYEVSDRGRIRSWAKPGRFGGRKASPHCIADFRAGDGYRAVGLFDRGRKLREYVHRLVLLAFVGPCPEGMECRHKNRKRDDNRLDNLEWGTPDDQVEDKIRHGSLVPWSAEEPAPILFDDPFIPVEAIIPWEVWKEVSRCEGYEVSNWGRVRSYWVRGRNKKPRRSIPTLMKPQTDPIGRRHVILKMDGGGRATLKVHLIVMQAFSPKVVPRFECRHVDGDPSHNHVRNLRWGSHAENMRDRALHGTDNRGERSHYARLTNSQILEIRRRRAAGESGSDLAREFGVKPACICDIHKRRTWKHI